jgi:hypothetical protein
MSAYSKWLLEDSSPPPADVLRKPFDLADLLRRVRKGLDAQPAAPEPTAPLRPLRSP